MQTKYIKHSKGWFVLVWDYEYNAQHIGGAALLRTPVECWAYDPTGDEPPIPYGYPEKEAWSRVNELACGLEEDALVPLACDALLSPAGEVMVGGATYSSIEAWCEAGGYDAQKVTVIDWRGTKAQLGAVVWNSSHGREVRVPF